MTKVFLLSTLRNTVLFDAAVLSFRSIRTGFPTYDIQVCGNGLSSEANRAISNVVSSIGGSFKNIDRTAHDIWIQQLIYSLNEPFWIADTDLVFFDKIEDLDFKGAAIVGRYEPTFNEEWTKTIHIERLHTCLMWIEPLKVRNHIRKFICSIPEPLRDHVEYTLVRQNVIPQKNKPSLFYDTMAGLYQSGINCAAFTEEQNQKFEHLHCATYVDAIAKSLKEVDIVAAHKAIYADPQSAKGLQQSQNEYYNKRAVV